MCAVLTHWGRVTHICVGNLIIIGSDNGLSPGRRQAIIWTNARILLIWPWGRNFSEILIGIQIVSFKKMPLKMSSAKWRPSWLGLNELICANHYNELITRYGTKAKQMLNQTIISITNAQLIGLLPALSLVPNSWSWEHMSWIHKRTCKWCCLRFILC